MSFRETPISGAYLMEQERIEDHRGFFARIWCKKDLRAKRGLKALTS